MGRNPYITHGQLCQELSLLPPNLTKILLKLSRKDLIEKFKNRQDKRMVHFRLSAHGESFLTELTQVVIALERQAGARLSDRELQVLMQLLQKIYLPQRT